MEIEIPTIYINNYALGDVIYSLFLNWFWLILPFILFPLFKWAWLWWRRELWEKKQKFMFLEMIPPREIERPIASMEHVFNSLWSIYSGIEGIKKFKKKWITGKKLEKFFIEIVSEGPNSRFFIRVSRNHVETVKAAFYAQYPDVELNEIREDYISRISWNAPDDKWNFYGLDEVLMNDESYPILTYSQFFEMKPENVKEEKRIDPMNILIESLAALKEGEKIWLQFRIVPVAKKDHHYRETGRRVINKLIFRKEETKKSLSAMALEGFGDIVTNRSASLEEKDKKDKEIPSEMKLTTREREIVHAIEKKIGKNSFDVNIRGMYLSNKKSFDPTRKSLMETFFASFGQPDLNGFTKLSRTKTKLYHFFVKRRVFLRKRRILRRYFLRETPFYPRKGGTFILNTEELATIFHPPVETRKSSTNIVNADIRKSGAPKNLPS